MMTNGLDLKSWNGGFLKKPSLLLSTVSLPICIEGCDYETCLFVIDGDSEVLERHSTLGEAVSWHKKTAKELGLT